MKLLTILVVFFSISIGNAQNSHTLVGFDFGFNPDTMYIAPGDTVHFINQGYHSATEIDSVDWANNLDNHNGGFDVGFGAPSSDMWFVINTPGKYYHICGPHAGMGMKGVIYVAIGNSIPEHYNKELNKVSFLGNGQLSVNYKGNSVLNLFDVSGKLISTHQLPSGQNEVTVQTQVEKGVYIFTLGDESNFHVSDKIYID